MIFCARVNNVRGLTCAPFYVLREQRATTPVSIKPPSSVLCTPPIHKFRSSTKKKKKKNSK